MNDNTYNIRNTTSSFDGMLKCTCVRCKDEDKSHAIIVTNKQQKSINICTNCLYDLLNILVTNHPIEQKNCETIKSKRSLIDMV